MSILRVIFCIRDEHETLVATLDMWKFRVVAEAATSMIDLIQTLHGKGKN